MIRALKCYKTWNYQDYTDDFVINDNNKDKKQSKNKWENWKK